MPALPRPPPTPATCRRGPPQQPHPAEGRSVPCPAALPQAPRHTSGPVPLKPKRSILPCCRQTALPHLRLHDCLQLRLHLDVALRLPRMQLRQQLWQGGEDRGGGGRRARGEGASGGGRWRRGSVGRAGRAGVEPGHAWLAPRHGTAVHRGMCPELRRTLPGITPLHPCPSPGRTPVVAAALALGRKLKRLAHRQLACGPGGGSTCGNAGSRPGMNGGDGMPWPTAAAAAAAATSNHPAPNKAPAHNNHRSRFVGSP